MSAPAVLVVEDDYDLRVLYRTILKVAGFDVREASDGLTALRLIDATVPDLIVLDLDLPRLNGHGVLHDLAAQAHTQDIPVIVVTGTDDQLETATVAQLLRKPISPEALVLAVFECLRGVGRHRFDAV